MADVVDDVKTGVVMTPGSLPPRRVGKLLLPQAEVASHVSSRIPLRRREVGKLTAKRHQRAAPKRTTTPSYPGPAGSLVASWCWARTLDPDRPLLSVVWRCK
ncbi:hypothetical protein Cob_v004219 [Colletotrichum orbiculare MAFF 240422]|uniref:Uncharacterized protein n=1 Tax=Colletotrichum orbiculare (strain 104-T / ATCC 96160 / CBS 514.97 / LARS 414 / MAFF 240422) TaxID=1213857 RepID=A0A484FY47_COLOR|nr:hypothetical protein Cob_v004219 [Colletotrichum orbiculare MAFF 240422]